MFDGKMLTKEEEKEQIELSSTVINFMNKISDTILKDLKETFEKINERLDVHEKILETLVEEKKENIE